MDIPLLAAGGGIFFRVTEFKTLLDDLPLCFPSVLSFSWDVHLNFSPNIETIRQADSAQKPNSDSCHLYAGGRLGTKQTGIFPEMVTRLKNESCLKNRLTLNPEKMKVKSFGGIISGVLRWD